MTNARKAAKAKEREQVEAVLLLCDAAQVANQKLYILGGGWTNLLRPNEPASMALAIKLSVPWNLTNRRMKLEARLVDEDGELVRAEGMPVMMEGDVEVGRPPGTKPGTELVVPIAFNISQIVLPPGGYVWQLTVDGEAIARAPFHVVQRPVQ